MLTINTIIFLYLVKDDVLNMKKSSFSFKKVEKDSFQIKHISKNEEKI